MSDNIYSDKPKTQNEVEKTKASEYPKPKSDNETASVEKEDYYLPPSASGTQLVEALLKAPECVIDQVKAGQFKGALFILLAIFIGCHVIYGIIVGSFSGNVQWFAAPLKIVIGATLSALLCYPSLYIFACLSGAKINPSQAFYLLIGGMTLTAILLLGFAPVAFIFTFSTQTVFFMGIIHLSIWLASIYFGIRYITMGLVRLGGRRNNLFITWSAILILTMLQMTTTLRPILGESENFLTSEKRFFLAHWLSSLKDEQRGWKKNY